MKPTIPRIPRDPVAARNRCAALARQLDSVLDDYANGAIYDPMDYLRLVHAYCRATSDLGSDRR